jgi:hypothetical protein
MSHSLSARFSRTADTVRIEDGKNWDLERRQREAVVIPALNWLIRQEAARESFSVEPLFAKRIELELYSGPERQGMLLHLLNGRFDDLSAYPVTACEDNCDMSISSNEAERETHDLRYDPAYQNPDAVNDYVYAAADAPLQPQHILQHAEASASDMTPFYQDQQPAYAMALAPVQRADW